MKKQIFDHINALGFDAYLVYDFRKSNYVGRQVLELSIHTTRKWVALLKKDGTFTYLLPIIEKGLFKDIEGEKRYFSSYTDFNKHLKEMLDGVNNLALEISPNNDIPVQDIVPAGFIELLKSLRPDMKLSSSANLTQYVSALWGSKGFLSHVEATKDLTEIKDIVFEYVGQALKENKTVTDYDVTQLITAEYKRRNLYTDEYISIASTNERTGDPHYWPNEKNNHVIEKNSIFLIDIWAKKTTENAVFSDSTFMAWIGPDPVPVKFLEVWNIVKEARDIGIQFVFDNINNDLMGYQIDRVVRDYIIGKGYGDFFVHRTGHSIDVNDHGSGADIDDFEKHDTRKILPDTGFSIEPGIYLPEFGVRNEIDMYVDKDNKPQVTTFKQDELTIINPE